MKINTLSDLYLEQIRDMHSCERQIIKAMPKMIKAAKHPKLKKVFDDHHQESQEQLERLDQILAALDKTPGRKVCAAAAGLIEEATEVIDNDGEDTARDAGLVCAAQKFEHYEIASYGCLVSYAHKLDRDKDTKLLEETLQEEKNADQTLSELATSVINEEAMG